MHDSNVETYIEELEAHIEELEMMVALKDIAKEETSEETSPGPDLQELRVANLTVDRNMMGDTVFRVEGYFETEPHNFGGGLRLWAESQ